MLKSKLNQLRASEGFTIIEVIIVLVIAAVIMLMVFLIVPQLQRTQRNSRRQQDARRILTAIEQVAANNNGSYASITQAQIEAITGAIADPTPNTTMAWSATANPAAAGQIQWIAGRNCLSAATGGTAGQTGLVANTTASTGNYAVVVFQENGSSYCVSI